MSALRWQAKATGLSAQLYAFTNTIEHSSEWQSVLGRGLRLGDNLLMKNPSTTDMGPENPCSYQRETLGDLPCTNISIRRATRRLAYLYDEAAECVDLKATQVTLAGTIDQMTDVQTALGPTLQELAGALAIQISALTHALRPLVRDGLVALQPDAQDKRTKRAALTEQGKARLKQALQAWSAVNHRVEEVLGPESASMLRALADQVASDGFLLAYRDAAERQKVELGAHPCPS